MGKHLFCKYKKALSIVLCLNYILQLPVWIFLHFFLQKSENNDWAFLVGFWGLNILLIFLVNFFHIGLPTTHKKFFPLLFFLILSGCFFAALEHKIYWASILLFVSVCSIVLIARCIWVGKFDKRYCEKAEHMQEESVIGFSIYVLPTAVLSVICVHLLNIIPYSMPFIFVCLLCSTVAFNLIFFTRIIWCKMLFATKSSRQVLLEFFWLLICYLCFVLGAILFKNTVSTFFLPWLGVAPILIRHKKQCGDHEDD